MALIDEYLIFSGYKQLVIQYFYFVCLIAAAKRFAVEPQAFKLSVSPETAYTRVSLFGSDERTAGCERNICGITASCKKACLSAGTAESCNKIAVERVSFY